MDTLPLDSCKFLIDYNNLNETSKKNIIIHGAQL